MQIKEVRDYCTLHFLVPFEGYATALPDGSCEAYPDPASKMGKAGHKRWKHGTEFKPEDGLPWTIGYGSTYDDKGKPVVPGEVWSHEKALYVKSIVTTKFLSNLISMSPKLITEPVPRLAAILSWIYNLGAGNYRISTFKKMVDSKNWSRAADECLKWNKGKGKKLPGLVLRRLAESKAIRNP